MMRDTEKKSWEVACRPCAKFFNQQETHCPVFKKADFEKHSEEYVVVEKADGTMISLWWKAASTQNNAGGSWQVSTSTVVSVGPEWIEMLQPLFDISDPKIQAALDPKFTYILELCSKKNKIITKYPDERVYLLVAINAESGEYASIAETDRMALALGLKRPKYFRAKEVGLKTLESFLEFAEVQSKSPEFPPDPEGFVIYWKEQPLCKLKNKTYSAKHPFHSLGLVAMKMNILERFWDKTTDDVMDVLPQPIKDFLDELGRKVELEVSNALKAVDALFDSESLEKLKIPSEFVKRARQVSDDPWLQSYLMRSREWLLGDGSGAEQAIHDRRSHFVDYLERNWRGKLPYWKETAVPEIVAEEKEFGAAGRVLGTTDM